MYLPGQLERKPGLPCRTRMGAGPACAEPLLKERAMQTTIVESSGAARALARSPIPALRRLNIEEDDASVRILGTVTSYYMKQLAQETIIPLLAGRSLHNRVAVLRD